MKNFFVIGPTPIEEECAQVGEPDYRRRALQECQRFIQLLRDIFGPEPEGAALRIKSFEHDFGTYHDVVCWFDPDMPESVDYAIRCENNTPITWQG